MFDTHTSAASLSSLHLELRDRAERTATSASVSLALVERDGQLRWAPPRCPIAELVPNSAAVRRRRLAADLRNPASADYDGRLVGVLRHRTALDGAAMTVALFLDGSALAIADGTGVSLAVGDWRQDPSAWPTPFELAEGLSGAAAVQAPVFEFAARLGIDEFDHDGFEEVCAAVVDVATANPTLAAAAGMDPATAALLPSLVLGPADLSDLLTGRFDPWSVSTAAALVWPAGASLVGGSR